MVNTVDFSKRLQKILDFYGLSATAFSEKITFNRSTISHLLSGRNKPSLEFVMKVLEEFPEVELYWLLNGKGNFPSTSQDLVSKKEVAQPQNLFQEQETVSKKLDSEIIHDKSDAYVVKSEMQKNDSEIDQIVIFYKDGSFKAYK